MKINEIGKEHWVLNEEGTDIQGLYTVDVTKAQGVDLWAKIDQVIQEYTRLHPMEMELHLRETKQIADSRLIDTAASQDGTLRWGCSIPPGLFFALQHLEPQLFGGEDPTDKRLYNEFLKRYKGFRICKKV